MIFEGHLRFRKGHFSMDGIFEKGFFYGRAFWWCFIIALPFRNYTSKNNPITFQLWPNSVTAKVVLVIKKVKVYTWNIYPVRNGKQWKYWIFRLAPSSLVNSNGGFGWILIRRHSWLPLRQWYNCSLRWPGNHGGHSKHDDDYNHCDYLVIHHQADQISKLIQKIIHWKRYYNREVLGHCC